VLYNALVATLSPGDEVVIPAPYWVSYRRWCCCATASRCRVVPAEQRLQLRPEDLDAAITPRPNADPQFAIEPVGAGYTEPDLKALAEVR